MSAQGSSRPWLDSLAAQRRREIESREQTVRLPPAWSRRMDVLGTL